MSTFAAMGDFTRQDIWSFVLRATSVRRRALGSDTPGRCVLPTLFAPDLRSATGRRGREMCATSGACASDAISLSLHFLNTKASPFTRPG